MKERCIVCKKEFEDGEGRYASVEGPFCTRCYLKKSETPKRRIDGHENDG
jgi:hypothetical protein